MGSSLLSTPAIYPSYLPQPSTPGIYILGICPSPALLNGSLKIEACGQDSGSMYISATAGLELSFWASLVAAPKQFWDTTANPCISSLWPLPPRDVPATKENATSRGVRVFKMIVASRAKLQNVSVSSSSRQLSCSSWSSWHSPFWNICSAPDRRAIFASLGQRVAIVRHRNPSRLHIRLGFHLRSP